MASVSSWFALVAAIFFQISSDSTSKTFAIYAPGFGLSKHKIFWLSFVKEFGVSWGFLSNILYTRFADDENENGNTNKNTRIFLVYLTGALLMALGYGLVSGLIGNTGAGVQVLLFIAMFVAGQGQCIVNTANVMVFVLTFSKYVGTAVGMIQAYSGLGPSLFVDFDTLVFRSSPKSFLLCLAVLPCIISVFYAIGLAVAYWKDSAESTSDGYFFISFAGCGVAAALWLIIMKIIDNSVSFNLAGKIVTFAVFVVLIAVPIPIGIFLEGANLSNHQSNENVEGGTTAGADDDHNAIAQFCLALFPGGSDFAYVLLFFSVSVSCATCVAVIDHMHMFIKPYDFPESTTKNIISLWSSFSFIGSMIGGFLCDLCGPIGCSRMWVISFAQLLMIAGHLVCAYSSLLYGAAMLGICSGIVSGVLPTVIFYGFGLKELRANYTNIKIVSPFIVIASLFIAKRAIDVRPKCHGSKCYQYAFIVFAAFCGLGLFLSLLSIFLKSKQQADGAGTQPQQEAS